MPTVLVIDDDRTVLHLVKKAFDDSPITVLTAGSAEEGMEAVRRDRPDALLLDIMLPRTSGLEIFEQVHRIDPKLPVIFITSGGTSDTAIEAMMLGATDYLLKPLELPKIREIVHRAFETRRLMRVPVGIPAAEVVPEGSDLLVGRSPRMLNVYKAIGRVASEDVTVLIHGESGTGKELVARAIYQHSRRAGGPFLAVNCAAIPDTLLESELFGHEKGSFTGADSRRIGKFEQCSGGTIFLDEIGDMSPLVQSKILRLLQEQRFERVGGNTMIETDVRIIVATNRDLEKMVEEEKFRADLFYRLNGFEIEIPPLRERSNDILLLLEHFLARFSRDMDRQDVEGISPDAVDLLLQYPWPGNVRELQSVVRQALLNATGPVIVPDFLPEEIQNGHRSRGPESRNGVPDADLTQFVEGRLGANTDNLYAETIEIVEKFLLIRVLRETGGNQSQAAKILGITRGSLRNKIRALGVSVDHVVSVGGG